MRIILSLLWLSALALSVACVAGDPQEPVVAKAHPHVPEWTNPTSSDPVAKDFQEVVVLCATRPDTPAFNNRWSRFLRDNYTPDMDVPVLIDEVVRQAQKQRAMQSDPRWMSANVSYDRVRASMQQAAAEIVAESK